MKINEQIKFYREKVKLSQEALAELIPCDPKTLSKYETGKLGVSSEILQRIGEILGFRFDITDTTIEKKEEPNPYEKVYTYEIIEDLDDDIRDFLYEEIDDMVESHLEAWGSRYFRKSIDIITFDLYRQHDFSGEIEFVEDRLERELTEEEKEKTFKYFNESVLNEFRH